VKARAGSSVPAKKALPSASSEAHISEASETVNVSWGEAISHRLPSDTDLEHPADKAITAIEIDAIILIAFFPSPGVWAFGKKKDP
jgi:hypothetical protein